MRQIEPFICRYHPIKYRVSTNGATDVNGRNGTRADIAARPHRMVAFGPEADAEITLKSADWTPENGRISPPPAYPPKRREVGQGLQAGKTYVEGEMLPKVVVVVDREINPCRLDDVWQALGARWQPYPATAIIEETKGLPLDPSLRQPLQTSKIVIDATPQLPGEGGPEHMAGNSKSLFVKACPEGLLRADALMDELGL